MVFAGTFLISFENESLITSLSSVVTCLGNVGPGFGSIGPTENFAHLTLFSKGILSVYMLAGRLELYPAVYPADSALLGTRIIKGGDYLMTHSAALNYKAIVRILGTILFIIGISMIIPWLLR